MTTLLILILQALLVAGVSGQEPHKLNQLIQSPISTDASKAFREARDQIKNGEWANAEQSFSRFIADHPQDRETPAALYWLAFALKQQSKFADADRTLTQLIAKFPASTWVNDARTMRVEIAPKLKNNAVIEQGVSAENEEIKLAALQSLFEAKPERAIAISTDILKPGSGASRVMKEGAITLLGESESKEAATALINAARNETDSALRKKVIRALGEREEESVVDELLKLFAADKSDAIRHEILSALAEIEHPRAQAAIIELARGAESVELRMKAIESLWNLEEEKAIDVLTQLYDVEKDERIKETLISTLGESKEKKALRKLIEIARRDSSIKLRKKAIEMIAKSDDPDAAAFLEEILKKN